MNEAEFTKRTCNALRACNCEVTVIAGGNPYQTIGIPDRFVAGTGLPGVWVEFKGTTTPVAPHQRVWMQRMLKHRVPVLVCRCMPHKRRRYESPTGKVLSTWEYERFHGADIREELIDAVKILLS